MTEEARLSGDSSSPAVEQQVDPPVHGDAGAMTPPSPPRRDLRLVVALKPIGETGYSAHLAAGADGCDPSFRFVDVADLADALAALPALVDEAQSRWREQPRYPTARPAAARQSTGTGRAAPAPQPTSAAATPPPDQPTPAPSAPSAGQLSLFG